ncbi:aminopeptidase P family protein [Jiulongibacter sediminis]|uniref:Xaa-Pro aminopeptidase n=1 Tax=Jiulongibacter sediminis TaxID=1605367 RepID=A0A0P7C514_9BACT|nr:aminopeptidase P family protein [Jiulongibacter sediminis]KPM47114.1 Xaa-Pro aminopeptidase [Jiulongibacter sediminis]TBX22675.1 Xaa-Pro aminopeptidase [Jiulongibacter sediminis]
MKLFPSQTYINRRNALKEAVGSGLILFQGNDEASMNYADNHYRFRQDSTFLYYFGINQAGLNAVIDCDSGEEIIFGDEFSIDDIIWIGQQETLSNKAEKVGILNVRPAHGIDSFLEIARHKKIHYLPPYRADNLNKLSQWLHLPGSKVNQEVSQKLLMAIINQRSYKSEEEIEQMTEAVNISGQMHINAMKAVKPGQYEFEAVSEIYRTAKASNSYLAYPAIFSINGQILHNHYHGNKMQSGRLVLNDSGAENEMCYSGDITRTIPVDGKFTTQQKDIYDIVLEMETSSIDSLKPGLLYKDIHVNANRLMLSKLKELGLVKGDIEEMTNLGVGGIFMPHGLGHMIGMDVHDMENFGEQLVGYREGLERSTQLGLKSLRLGRELEKDFVITVEPGLYFIPDLIEKWKADKIFTDFINYDKLKEYYDFGGIRIEDNILITENGSQILGKPIPKTTEEVEETMAL